MEEGPSSLIARDAERARLVAAVRDDRPVAVVGEAGIGKTSLVRSAGLASGRRLYEGGGFATLHDSPLLALRRAIGLGLRGDDGTIASLIERHVGPDILFVDDLQWTDRSSASVLRMLAGRIGLVVAIRSGDPGSETATTLVDELGFERIQLGGVGADAARNIVSRANPTLGATEVERLVARAGGNPLVLEEMAVRGEPSLVLARSIHAGLSHLSAPGRDVMELLALIDRPVDRLAIGDALDEPLHAGFVVERDGQVEIRHVLIAEAIRDALGRARREELHERAAAIATDPAEVAKHLALAGLRSRAGAVALEALPRVVDPVERARLLVVVAEAVEAADSPATWLAAGAALSAVSDWPEVVRVLDRPTFVGGMEELGSRDALLAHALFALGRNDGAREVLDRAERLSVPPGSPAAGQLAIERAAFMVNVDGRLLAAIEELSSQLQAYGPQDPVRHSIRTIVESMRMLAMLPVDVDYLRGSVDAAIAAGQYATAADLARVVNFALLIWHGPEPAVAFVDGVAQVLARAGALGASSDCKVETIQASLLAGRPADAVARSDELLELPVSVRATQTATIFRARAFGMMGLLDAAALSLAGLEPTVTDDFVGRGELLAAQADLALWGGMAGRAIELTERVVHIASPVLGAYTLPELTRAWAMLEIGQPPARLSAPIPAPTQAGAPHEIEGILLLHAGEVIAAATRFAEAATYWSGHHRLRALWCRWAEGEALRRAGDDRAIARLEKALEDALASQIEVVAVRIRRSLRLAGRRLPVERSPRVAGPGLTQREREIVQLAGQGLTNAEMARRMGLGRPTVARILSNAMGKLGAGSRGQAVSLVAEPRDVLPGR